MRGLPQELDRSEVGREHAADDLDEGRFAGSVVADQSCDFPRWEVKAGVLQGDDGAEAPADAFRAKQRVRYICGTVHNCFALSIARSEAPLSLTRAVPGKTISPPMSDRPATCESVSSQLASVIGGPQSPTMAGSRFESACKTGSVFFPATSTTGASVEATQLGGCSKMLW